MSLCRFQSPDAWQGIELPRSSGATDDFILTTCTVAVQLAKRFVDSRKGSHIYIYICLFVLFVVQSERSRAIDSGCWFECHSTPESLQNKGGFRKLV